MFFGNSRIQRAHAVLIRLLATCSADTTIKIWQIGDDWRVRKKTDLVGHQRWVWDAAFSADSAYLVSGLSLFHLLVVVDADALILSLIRPRGAAVGFRDFRDCSPVQRAPQGGCVHRTKRPKSGLCGVVGKHYYCGPLYY